MKIAFLSFYSGIIERGVETLIPEVASRLGKKHEVVVFQAGPGKAKNYQIIQISSSWKPEKLQPNFNLQRRLFLDNDSLAIRDFTKRALLLLKKESFDIVVPWNNGWQTLLCKISRVGKIVTVGQAGLGWDDRVNLLLFPDCFVGFTKTQVAWAKKVNPFVKTAVVPNGVDLVRFNPKGRKVFIDLPKPIVLCAGALVPMKRQHLAIKAVSRMKRGSLLLVGKGELKNNLEELGSKLLPGRFKLLEASHSDIDRIYRSVDLFTFPTSSYESFGIVLLEAMASGLPVVANNDPIRREIVGEGGLVVNPEDSGIYAETLEKALKVNWDNKPRQQAEEYSWDTVSQKYDELFKEIVK